MSKKTIIELMKESGVKFGTSGARGLVADMTDRLCYAYTLGFLLMLRERGELPAGGGVAVGGDLRPSSPRIMAAAAAAVEALGCSVHYLGLVPSPVVALYGLDEKMPTVMVTGSHIPADRNGMKFTTQQGEITKTDEAAMKSQSFELNEALFDEAGGFNSAFILPEPILLAQTRYLERYQQAFGATALEGLRVGVYGHSAVGRDLLCELYESLGAQVVRLGFSEEFIPVDTEAIRPEDDRLAAQWAGQQSFDAIVSTDGDSDRPLTSDEAGRWLRGDVTGILSARFYSADSVATPVSCNGALELSEEFQKVERTQIGSPYVIAGMQKLEAENFKAVVGYEANGGFLHATPLQVPGGEHLPALPTRDAVAVHLALLVGAKRQGVPISEWVKSIPARFTASDRDQGFATERSRALLAKLSSCTSIELAQLLGSTAIESTNQLDGLRIFFASGEVVHLRPSGNAPELRCYSEADSPERAQELVAWGLERARELGPELAS